MEISYVAPIAAHVVVLIASVLLFRARRTMPLVIMIVGSAFVLAVEVLSLAAYLGYLGESSLFYLGTGLPIGVGSMGWVLFSVGLFWFAASQGREQDRRGVAV